MAGTAGLNAAQCAFLPVLREFARRLPGYTGDLIPLLPTAKAREGRQNLYLLRSSHRFLNALFPTPMNTPGRPRPSFTLDETFVMRALILALLIAGAIPLAQAAAPTPARPAGEVAIGERLRDATLQGLNGPPRALATFRGKPLIINVWASWCDPCRAEMASLDRLAWLDIARSFSIIGISTDDDSQQALAWLKASNATLSQYIDHQLQMETMLGASQIPLTVLIDAQGRVREKIYGSRQWDSPESLTLIRRAFAPRP